MWKVIQRNFCQTYEKWTEHKPTVVCVQNTYCANFNEITLSSCVQLGKANIIKCHVRYRILEGSVSVCEGIIT